MLATQSPGPKYNVPSTSKESTKETASSFTFGVSGTERHSYLPARAQGRRKGGLCDQQEAGLRAKQGRDGTEAVQKVRSCVGTHFQSKDRTHGAFSFGNSRRNHFADRRGNHIDGASMGIGNRRARSVYADKWA